MNQIAQQNTSQDNPEMVIAALQSENEELKLDLAKMTNLCLQLKKYIFGQRSERHSIVMSKPLPMFPEDQIQTREIEEEIKVEAHSRKKFNPRKLSIYGN